MNKNKMFGYLVSVPLPLDKTGTFLPDVFRKAIQKLLEEGCDGIYIFGTSGEGYAVSNEEFEIIVSVFADATSKFKGLKQVGCIGLSSEQVIHRCRIVLQHGLKSVQITLPFWKKLNDGELMKYFSEVCGSFPEMSFLLYNNPNNKRKLKGVELEAIHAKNPNLIGAKTGSGSWFDFYELITESPSISHFVTEAAFMFSKGIGAKGLIPSSNYVFPQKSKAYFNAVMTNDLVRAQHLHKDIMRFFYKTAMPLVERNYIDGAIDKAYAKIGGMDMPLHMKSPYIPLHKKDYEWLKSIILSEFEKEED